MLHPELTEIEMPASHDNLRLLHRLVGIHVNLLCGRSRTNVTLPRGLQQSRDVRDVQ